MFSYWEEQSFVHYDHVIIGAGIVGLSVGIELKKKYPDQAVLVLERGLIPTGASTRNAGFACMGSLTEILDDLQNTKESTVVQIFEWRKRGLEMLRERLGDAKIGYAQNGSHELIAEKDLDALGNMEYVNWILKNIAGKPSFRRCDERIADFGFSTSSTAALIENTNEGELHTGKMMRALIEYANKQGVEIRTGADVDKYEESANRVTISLKDRFRKTAYTLECSTLSLCTNAFTKDLMKKAEATPGRGQILITKPIENLKFKGIFHIDKGYYYFRELDGRILIGGGRNSDISGETTTDFDTSNKIQKLLEQKLSEQIIPGVKFEVEQRWSGIMAFGETKKPVVQQFTDRVYGAFKMGGMGVALGSYCAKELAAII